MTWEQFYKPQSLNASDEGDDLFTGEQLRAAVAAAVEAECKRINEAHWQFFEERMRARGETEMTEKPVALRLADALETLSPLERDAAAELRRLHSVNAQLLEALGNLEEYSKRMGNVASNLAAAKGGA